MGLVDRSLLRFARRGLRAGIVSGSGGWAAVGAIALAIRWIRRSNAPRKLYSVRLDPGSRVTVTRTR